MAQIARSKATLRIMGDDLEPSEISEILGCKASNEQIKGQLFVGKNTGKKRTAKIGMWRLQASECEPENLNLQISEILEKVTSDINIWKSLSEKYHIEMFCGLFMNESNEGIDISSLSLKSLGERGIMLALDVYDGHEYEYEYSDMCPCESGKVYGECCGRKMPNKNN